MLELVGLGSDPAAGEAAAAATGGRLYINHPGEHEARPYSTLLRAVTDDIDLVAPAADVGLYLCFPRAVKPEGATAPLERAVASFAMVGHPDLSHHESDAHWRDTHGPLALKSHSAMCDYTQLSFLATLSGIPLDGVALCSFSTRPELSEKFFNDEEAEAAIRADVSSFADLRRSLRRVVLSESN